MKNVRKDRLPSWPQCVLLLVIAGAAVAGPETKPANFMLAGISVAIVVVAAFLKLAGGKSNGSEKDDSSD